MVISSIEDLTLET